MQAHTARKSGTWVREVELYRASSGEVETVRGNDIRFDYRHTSFAARRCDAAREAGIAVEAVSKKFWRASTCAMKSAARASRSIRKAPGCIFKNPPGGSAGRMIDELKLKGHRVGDAVVSDRHANFFVNVAQCDVRRHAPLD